MCELKPCPFCGGKATFDLILAGCRPQCLECGVHLMLGDVGVGWYATEAEAAEDWNRRAIPADQVLVPSELLAELLEAAKDGAAHKGEYLSKKYGEPELFAKFDTLLHP